jgi:hypothetical protein
MPRRVCTVRVPDMCGQLSGVASVMGDAGLSEGEKNDKEY